MSHQRAGPTAYRAAGRAGAGSCSAGAEIEAQNPWTQEVNGGFVLHPEAPGEGTASLRFRDLRFADSQAFSASIRTNDERCRPVLLRLEVHGDDDVQPVTLGELELAGAVDRVWSIPFPELPEAGDLVLSCELAAAAADNNHSGITIEGAVLASGDAPSGTTQPPQPVSVRLLFDGFVEDYFAAAADQPDCLWIFHHLAKTAGVSVLTEVSEALSPYVNVFGNAASEFPDVERALAHHLPAIARGEYRFATGHFDGTELERIRTGHPAGARPFTFLRHPVSRYVSQYVYTRTPAEPNYQEVRERFPRWRRTWTGTAPTTSCSDACGEAPRTRSRT